MRSFQYFLLILVSAVAAWPQPSPSSVGNKLTWKTCNNGAEFSLSMPDGTTGFSDETQHDSLGIVVTKRVFVSRAVEGAIFSVDIYSGDVKELRTNITNQISRDSRGPFQLAGEQKLPAMSIRTYRRQSGNVASIIQTVLLKKILYLVSAHFLADRDAAVQHFFSSMQIASDGKSYFPNASGSAATPRTDLAPEIREPPALHPGDSDYSQNGVGVSVLYNPAPRFGVRKDGRVKLKVVFSDSGRIGTVEYVSGDRDLAPGAIAAAKRIIFVPKEKNGRFITTTKQLEYSMRFN